MTGLLLDTLRVRPKLPLPCDSGWADWGPVMVSSIVYRGTNVRSVTVAPRMWSTRYALGRPLSSRAAYKRILPSELCRSEYGSMSLLDRRPSSVS